MSNEIKIGDFYRTISGLIRRAKTIKSGKRQFTRTTETLINGVHRLEDIVKYSKDITELLEDTDILKVKISEEWVEKEDTIAFIVVEQLESIKEIKEDLENGMYTIEQILTHEQFEQNSYKVGV